MKQSGYILGIVALIVVLVFVLRGLGTKPLPRSFDECVRARYPITDTFPRICATPQKEFVETLPHIEKNITITSPQPDDVLSGVLRVAGEAQVFENVLHYKLTDETNLTLVEGRASTLAPDVGRFGVYEIEAVYAEPRITKGILAVFNFSAKDGSVENLVEVPVKFATSSDRVKVSVFFGNSFEESEALQCEKVFPVSRLVEKTPQIAKRALEELFVGPNTHEKTQGFFTSLNEGVVVKSVTIANGTARADFSKRLNEGVAGSCRVSAIRSQITQTLKQFPSIERVVISIEGKTEEVLQP